MKQLKRVTTRVLHAESAFDPYVASINEYDSEGRIILAINYDEQGGIEQKSKTDYTPTGKISEIKEYLDEDTIGEHIRYERGENDEVIAIHKEFADGSFSKMIFEKEDKNRSLEIKTVDDEGELEEREVHFFDEKGNIILRETYNWRNILTHKFENQYNAEGLLIKQTENQVPDKLILTSELEYNENGQVISQVTRNQKNQITHRILMEYDKLGRITKQQVGNYYIVSTSYNDAEKMETEVQVNANGITEYEKIRRFDSEGILLEEITGNLIRAYEYEYFD
jgi:hypothetical protein